MNPDPTPEQRQIQRTLAAVLAERCPVGRLVDVARTGPGYDERLWRLLAGELGLPGLALPAEYGGAGCGPVELALACEEAGRALLPSPLLATAVLAAPLVAELGTPGQRREVLPRLAAGELVAAPVLPSGAGGRAGGVQARRDGPGWLLYGEAGHVPHGHRAGLLVVAAHTGGYTRSRTLLFLVDGAAPGLARARVATLDETRPQARVELRDVPAALLGGDDGADATAALERVRDHAAVHLAAEAVGAADRALADTVAYVGVREQFGRPVGSFQAVKHRLADLHVAVRAARSAARYAAWAARDAPDELPTAAPLALARALEAQRAAAGEAVQLHGGIGFTWEHHAHLYLKRATADDLLFGPPHRLRARAADRAGLFAASGPAAEPAS
ncbi:acyl-CoA dehydrogenase family protein [Streptomyces capparidis]